MLYCVMWWVFRLRQQNLVFLFYLSLFAFLFFSYRNQTNKSIATANARDATYQIDKGVAQRCHTLIFHKHSAYHFWCTIFPNFRLFRHVTWYLHCGPSIGDSIKWWSPWCTKGRLLPTLSQYLAIYVYYINIVFFSRSTLFEENLLRAVYFLAPTLSYIHAGPVFFSDSFFCILLS